MKRFARIFSRSVKSTRACVRRRSIFCLRAPAFPTVSGFFVVVLRAISVTDVQVPAGRLGCTLGDNVYCATVYATRPRDKKFSW